MVIQNQDLIADAVEGTTTGYSVTGHATTNAVTTTPTLVINNADDLTTNGESTVNGATLIMALMDTPIKEVGATKDVLMMTQQQLMHLFQHSY